MKYVVEWTDDSLEQLAHLWTESSLPQSITDAAHQIDQELSTDPFQDGEFVHEGLWSLVKGPLCVLFSIDEKESKVEVARVRLKRTGP